MVVNGFLDLLSIESSVSKCCSNGSRRVGRWSVGKTGQLLLVGRSAWWIAFELNLFTIPCSKTFLSEQGDYPLSLCNGFSMFHSYTDKRSIRAVISSIES